MKKYVVLSLFLALLLYGGVTGKIVGRVYDAETGEGLPAANVIIEGTVLGAATDPDGYFIILDVPPGVYSVTARVIGYEPMTIENVKVSADLTTTLEFPLRQTVIEKKPVVVVAKRPIIKKDLTTSVAIVGRKEIEAMPVSNVQDIVAQQAGSVRRGGQIHIRGGRAGETVYMVDGIELKDPITGAYDTHVPQISIEETSIYTGGFGAEFGNAQSGVINIVTREGRAKFSGDLIYRTSDMRFLGRDIHRFFDRDSTENLHRFEYALSFPIIQKKLRAFVSGELERTDGRWIHTDSKRWTYFGKISWAVTPKAKFALEGLWNKRKRHFINARWIYHPDGLPDVEDYSNLIGLSFTYAPSAKTYMKLVYGRYMTQLFYNVFEDGTVDANGDGFINPTDHDTTIYRVNPWTGEVDTLIYPSDLDGVDDFADVDCDQNVEINGVETDLYWPELDYPFTRYQDEHGYYTSGYYRIAWHKDRSVVHTIKGDLTTQWTKHHEIRTGFEVKIYDLFYYTADMASGGNVYMEYYKVKPWGGALFATDKMEFEGLVVNAGMRLDIFDPRADYPADPYHPVTDISTGGEILNPVRAPMKHKWSPRLGVSHPITERDQLHFTYGHYFQIPRLALLYRNMNYDFSGAFPLVGNPNLEPEKTVSYEIGIKHAFSDHLLIDVTAFYKDISGLTDTEAIFYSAANYYTRYKNADYGSAKGFEVTFKKFSGGFWPHVSWNLVYTYQIARGKSSSERQNYEFIWAGWVIPTKEHYLDWDQRHTITFNLAFEFPQGEPMFGVRGLDNLGISFVANYGSGFPWTPPSRSLIQRINEERMPPTFNVDMKIHKDVKVGPATISFFTVVHNLTDRKNLLDIADENWYYAFGDPEGRWHNILVWSERRLIRVGIEIKW